MEDKNEVVLGVARVLFEQFFNLDGVGYEIASDALQHGVIATPYQAVEMICEANVMYRFAMRERLMTLVSEASSAEEVQLAIRSHTFAPFAEATVGAKALAELNDDVTRRVRDVFGVPDSEETGTGEKYKQWAESRGKPIN